ncbi:MAG: hypothetical protein CM15mP49_16440 [Actinomycetota bacterium]|nr:MAG: hypothetical protein CM15mP49_16440 [Actinomycetota bacterium]
MRDRSIWNHSDFFNWDCSGNLRIKVSPREVELASDTDTALLDEGFITVTGLIGYRSENEQGRDAAESIERYANRLS